jgi:hypothetical protein
VTDSNEVERAIRAIAIPKKALDSGADLNWLLGPGCRSALRLHYDDGPNCGRV